MLAVPAVLRFAAYTFAVLLFTASLPTLVEHAGIAVFKENGPVEWAQLGLILTAAAVFIAGGVRVARFRQLFVLLACACALAGFRELDGLLDERLPWIGWKIGFVVLPYALALAYVSGRILRSQVAEFFATRAFAILWAAILVAIPIAQLVGHGPLLRLVMGDLYVFEYKQMIEEILELTGYMLLVIGGIESVTQLRPRRVSREPPKDIFPDKGAAPSIPRRTPSPGAPLAFPVSSSPAVRVSLIRRLQKAIGSSHGDSRRAR